MGDLDKVRFGGKIVDRRTSEMLAEAERLAQVEDPSIKDFRLTQGSFSNHVGASAGTHSGPGSFDMYSAGYTSEQKEIIGLALRKVGFASWRRREIPGTWREHWHGIAMDTEGLPPVAARQVKAYLNGGDGLKGNGEDPDPRPKEINTWEEYREERGADVPEPVAVGAGAAGGVAPAPDPYGMDPGVPLDRDSDADGLTDAFERLAGTNLLSGDSDADGLSDAYEAAQSHTDPLSGDTDRDGLGDAAELASGSDAGRLPGTAGVVGTGVFAENVRNGVEDADADGLSDHAEKLVGLRATDSDSDDDGLADGAEASLGTDPLLADTDHDGLTDDLELEHGSDPLGSFVDSTGRTIRTAPWTLEAAYARHVAAQQPAGQPASDQAAGGAAVSGAAAGGAAAATPDPFAIDPGQPPDVDTDQDGLTDAFEKLAGTSLTLADTDKDGLSDGYEALKSKSDPLADDTDDDGASDAQEVALGTDAGSLPGTAGVVGSGALAENVRDGVRDADKDGLSDHAEEVLRTDADKADSDGDSLADGMEVSLGTNPLLADSDGDGLYDAIEVQYGLDPLAPGSALGVGVVPGGAAGLDGAPTLGQDELSSGTTDDPADSGLGS